MRRSIYLISPFMVLLMSAAVPAHAQFWERIKDAAADAATDAVEGEVRDKSADAVHGAVEVAENAVMCAVADTACIEKAQMQGKPVAVTDAQGNVVKQIPAAGTPGAGAEGAQGIGTVNANYDFKPGERTIFAADFSGATVGNFPRTLEFRGGTIAVVEWRGGRALRVKTEGAFDIHLSEKLPQRFTLEFETLTSSFVNNLGAKVIDAEGEPVGAHFIQVSGYGDSTGVASYKRGGIASMQKAEVVNERMVPVRVMADGAYVKVYVGTTRVANMPNAELGRSRTLRFDFTDVRDKPIYIANIRVAAGGRDLYAALSAEGRVAVQNILFDTGKATIQPASAGTLEEIATLLAEHADLQLLVEGHTDNTGGFETNMALSKERAAAVKAYLVGKHDIDGARLRTIGLGATQSVASNDTETGRAENRRVELVKL